MIKSTSLRTVRNETGSNLTKNLGDCFVTALLAMTFFILFFSCGEKEKQISIPSNILPKEKMAQVLTDIHIAEAEANLNSHLDSISKLPINFDKIFKKDTIGKQQYEESLSFYIDHPQLLDSIYVQVLNELSKMQGATAK